MKRVESTLTFEDRGPDTTALHEALSVLGFPISHELELEEQRYGEATARAVGLFKERQQLEDLDPNRVGEKAAERMNALLAERGLLDDGEEGYSVTGQVAEPDGDGVAELTVRAFDRCLGRESELGASSTDRDGRYAISYDRDRLVDPARGQADLLVRAFASAGEILVESPLILNAARTESVNLVVGDREYRGPPLFRQLERRLAEYLEDVDLDRIEARDLYCVANATSTDAELVHHFVTARQWASRWSDLSPAVFFAWFRGGLTPRWGALLTESARSLRSLVENAVSENVVPRETLEEVAALDAALASWRSDFLITSDERPVSRGTVGQLLAATRLAPDQRRAFLSDWQTFEGDLEDFWNLQRDRLDEAAIGDLDLTLQLGFLTRNHVPLVESLKEHGEIRRLGDVARMRIEDWLHLLEDGDIEIPDDIRGDDLPSRRRAFAGALVEATHRVLPTRAMMQTLSEDPTVETEELEQFFEARPDFDFRTQSIRQLLDRDPDALADFPDQPAIRKKLEALQRVFHLAPSEVRSAAAGVLWKNGLHSAWSITLRGQEDLFSLFDGDEDLALRVLQNAQTTQQTSQALFLKYFDSKYSFGYVMPKAEPQIEGEPDLESLFGPQGYCECAHCQSFFSPSAYLVDLFLFLQKAKTVSSGSPPYSSTALDVLFERRPDLANLELDCDNALTPLPYLDVVHEILENAILPRAYDTHTVFVGGKALTMPSATEPVPQTEVDAATLKAYPQHLNLEAYERLRDGDGGQGVVFPWNLPFDIWAAEARVNLEHLGVPRWRLMASILGQADKTSVAAEALGLTPAERAIAVDANPGASRLAEYWGLTGQTSELEEVTRFLEQSGLEYLDLKELLSLRYIQGAGSNGNLTVRFDPPSSCQIDDAWLDNLDAAALSRIHRFVRLQRRGDETPRELDQTVSAFGGEIDDAFLRAWSDILRIEEALPRRLDRAKILTWWAPIDTHDYPDSISLYRALFLDPSLDQPIEEEFELNQAGTDLEKADGVSPTTLDLQSSSLDPDLQAHLLAALRWSMSELSLVVTESWGGSKLDLTLANLSYLFRVSSLCRALRLRVSEYSRLKAILGTDPLPGPDDPAGAVRPGDTLEFVGRVETIRELDLDPELLDYLARHRSRDDSPIVFGTEEIAQTLSVLRVEVNKLLAEVEPDGADLDEVVRSGLARVLAADDLPTAFEIVEDDPPLSDADDQEALSAERETFLEAKLGFFPDLADAKAQLVGGATSNPGGATSDPDDRFAYVQAALRPYLVENAVIQILAEAVTLEPVAAEALLKEILPNPAQPGAPAIRVFFADDFLEHEVTETLAPSETPDQTATLLSLFKIARLIESFGLNVDAVDFLITRRAESGLPDVSAMPLNPMPGPLAAQAAEQWKRLLDLALVGRRHFSESLSIFELLASAFDANGTRTQLLARLADTTQWNASDLEYLCGSSVLNLAFPTDYQSADWLLELAEVMPLIERLGVAAHQAREWTTAEVGPAQTTSIRHALEAKYGSDAWLDVAKPLRDRVRMQQRDALISFVLHHRSKPDQSRFTDVDDLYGFYLVDPEMSSCAMTSRTVLAASSVQLFVQRILMNIDESEVAFTRAHAEEWKWRRQYRVWEANRKVLLWPENWIEPELRDNKSPFFTELEGELLQDELNKDTIERAYENYLRKLDDVAHLKVAGVHFESENRTLHVFGHTSSDPPKYFYRRWEKQRDWTPWERVELDISNSQGLESPQLGVLLLPIVYNRRLYLFWPVFKLKHEGPDHGERNDIKKKEAEIAWREDTIKILQDSGDHDEVAKFRADIPQLEAEIEQIEEGHDRYEISMDYSEYRQGSWSPKRATRSAIRTPIFSERPAYQFEYPYFFSENPFTSGKQIDRYFFVPAIDAAKDRFTIKCYYSDKTKYYRLNATFVYDVCKGELLARPEVGYKEGKKSLPDHMSYMKAKDDAGGSEVPLRVWNAGGDVDLLFEAARPEHLLASSMDRGVFKHTTPFLYQDDRRAFLIVPPSPREPFKPLISQITRQVISGKAGTFQVAAYRKFTNTDVAVAEVAPEIQAAGTNDLASRAYFGAGDSGRIIYRQPPSPPTTVGTRDIAKVASMSMNVGVASEIPAGITSQGTPTFLEGDYGVRSFYHPYACRLLEQINREGVEGLIRPDPRTSEGRVFDRQMTPDDLDEFDFVDEYEPNFSEIRHRLSLPRDLITFDHDDPYALYNWELFFHIPLLMATRCFQDQRFEAAQRWFHAIFDPTETEGDAPYRFWKIKPFHAYTEKQMEEDFARLLAGEERGQIRAWQEDPFNPHLLARLRRVVYMKATVMKYLDNLIAWADLLFRQDTLETLNEATQLYVLAGQILGKLPVMTDANRTDPKTFSELAGELDSLGNAWLEIEQVQNGQAANGGDSGPASSASPDLIPYFCFPPNEKLLGYWDAVADRLYKIRHCMNIEGVVRELPLFQPPIDPGLLVRARAAGIDLTSAINDLYAPVPKYRFSVMVQQAQEICQEVKSLGSALLSMLEKKDAESLSSLRASHEVTLLKASRELRAQKIEEIERSLQALAEGRAQARLKYEYYRDREFMSPAELTAFGLARDAGSNQLLASEAAAGGSAAYLIPDIDLGALAGPMGGVFNTTRVFGGDKIGKGMTAASKWFEMKSVMARVKAEETSTLGSYQRRQDDWDLQKDLAEQETKEIDQRILAAQVRLAFAQKERDNLELHISQSEAVADFVKNKYTNEDLYAWMAGQISSVYFQSYQLAYDIAKQAEKAFAFELGIRRPKRYIQFGYWDNMRKGLLAGERLSLDLKRLEMAYLDANRRELELERHVSLRRLDPIALLYLRTKGSCTIEVPEWLFDLDTPGHYNRRIKSVAVSIPAVVGPSTGVHCTLTLLKSSVRSSPVLKADEYARKEDGPDDRFVDYPGGTQSIVTSHGQSDSGMFETNLRDERFLTFEGCGAAPATWKLELPSEFRSFDYDTITDLILHIRYTARQGGAALAEKATESVQRRFQDVDNDDLVQLLSLSHDFPNEWHRFRSGTSDFEATIGKRHFPYLIQDKDLEVTSIDLYGMVEGVPEPIKQPVEGVDLLNEMSDALNEHQEHQLVLAEGGLLSRDATSDVFIALRYRVDPL